MRKLVKLIRELSDPDADKRRAAAEELSGADERAVYPLIKSLRDDNPGVQDAAMRSLISIGGEVTAYMVLPLLREEALFRNTALIILREIGSDTLRLLKMLLKDKDDDIRKFAIDLVCEIGVCEYPEEIVRILEADPNPNVRASAAKALGILRYRQALPHILRALQDEEWVCFSALETLAIMTEVPSAEPIIALLSSQSEVIRYAAIETLGRIGTPDVAEALLQYLPKAGEIERTAVVKGLVLIGISPSMTGISNVLQEMIHDGEWEDKLIAVKGFGDLQWKEAIPDIIDLAGSLDQSEPEAEERLSFLKSTLRSFGCCTELTDVLNDPAIRYRGRQIAIEILGDLKCRGAVPVIVKLLKSAIRDERRAAAKALGKVGEGDVRQALSELIDDEDGHVRREAVAALGRIGDGKSFDPIMELLSCERYRDVIEEAVKALLAIDAERLFSHLESLHDFATEIVGKNCHDVEVLLKLSNDQNPTIRAAALSGLGRTGADAARQRCASALRDAEASVRKVAVSAMAELECGIEEIKPALRDRDKKVRLSAVKAIGSFQDAAMSAVLEPMLRDKEVPVVIYTAETLARLCGRRSAEMLAPLADHEEPAVRERILAIIESLAEHPAEHEATA